MNENMLRVAQNVLTASKGYGSQFLEMTPCNHNDYSKTWCCGNTTACCTPSLNIQPAIVPCTLGGPEPVITADTCTQAPTSTSFSVTSSRLSGTVNVAATQTHTHVSGGGSRNIVEENDSLPRGAYIGMGLGGLFLLLAIGFCFKRFCIRYCGSCLGCLAGARDRFFEKYSVKD